MKLAHARLGWLAALLMSLSLTACGAKIVGDGDSGPAMEDAGRDSGPAPDGGPLPGECATGCLVEGTCFPDGVRNPANPCEVCTAALAPTAWSANDGSACDDGLFCTTGDVCADRACGGAARACDDGVACDGTETCDEAASACAHGVTTCPAGQLCDSATDACVATCTGCVIGGSCYGAGQVNPMSPCEVCAVGTSRSAWSPNEGASCDDGAFCTTGDVCSGGVCAGSAARNFCADAVACNGTETCDEATDSCAPGASTCAIGQLCNASTDSCVTTCSGCLIGGVCFAPATRNLGNQCQVCTPTASVTAWTANTGVSCDDGLYCTTGETCSAAAVCGAGAARVCADAVTCNGTETCNETTDRCDVGTSTCTGGQLCNTVTNACVLSCVGGTTLCGATCTSTAHDPANCGGCGVTCTSSQACLAGTCRRLAGFSGATGAAWELVGVAPSRGFQSWVPAGSAFMYGSGGTAFQRLNIAAGTWATLASSPGTLGSFAAPASSLGDIWGVTAPNVMRYSVAAGTWSTVRSDVAGTGTDAQTAADAAGNLWSYNSANSLVRYDPAANTLTYFPTGTTASNQTRVVYDPTNNSIYFGSAFGSAFYRFDIATSAITTASATIPEGFLSDATCADHSGHIYAGLGCGGTTFWQFTIATGVWARIPDLPVDQGCNSTCSVHEDGWLYFGDQGGGPPTYRIRLL